MDRLLEYDLPQIDRFWQKVRKSRRCWEWLGGLRDGYGITKAGNGTQTRNAHRVSWMLCRGAIPNGLLVLHRCDNPKCVKPSHLFLGTIADNMADRDAKGRQAKGERAGRSLLTEVQAREILKKKPLGKTPWGYQLAVAHEFGLNDPQVVRNIWKRKTWRHI